MMLALVMRTMMMRTMVLGIIVVARMLTKVAALTESRFMLSMLNGNDSDEYGDCVLDHNFDRVLMTMATMLVLL